MLNPAFLRICLAAALLGPFCSMAMAAELVMVELKSCIYCIKFNREMAPAYQASAIGREVPLRRINQRKWAADLEQVDRPPYTPVFILVEKGRELGRFAGYGGPEMFKKNLALLLERKRRKD